MKTNKINITVCIVIFLLMNVPFLSFSQLDSSFNFIRSFNIPNDSSEIEYPDNTRQLNFDTYYWGDNNDGITPSEVIFVESFNKIYIFGSRGVVVFNPTTNEVETVIPLSNFGQYNKLGSIYVENKFGGNQMAFDGDHLLYCFTHDFEIKVIDLQINEVIQSCSLGEFTNSDFITRSILKYNTGGTFLFLIVRLGSLDSRCYRFNVQNISNYYYTLIHKDVFDFEINTSQSTLFASYSESGKYYFSVLNFSFFPVSGISPFEPDFRHGLIEYIYEPENNINKAVLLQLNKN